MLPPIYRCWAAKVNKQDQSCLGVVLAGGLSSRMGQDKAQLMRNNTKMLDFSQQILKAVGINNIVISGNQYQVPDLIENAGPVGGIYSVIKHYQPHAILVLPVDLPLITAEALNQLKRAGELSQKACYFQGPNSPLYLPNTGYLELFLSQAFNNPTVVNRTTDATNKAPSKKSGPSIKALLSQVPNQSLALNDETILFNTNTPEQWQQAQNKFS